MTRASHVLLLAMFVLPGCAPEQPLSKPIPAPEQPIGESVSTANTTDWPFSEPPDTSVITLRRILDGSRPIRSVFHDEDGDWQFLDGGDVSEEDAAVVSLKSIVDRDPTVKTLADLPQGWTAERTTVGETWKREGP